MRMSDIGYTSSELWPAAEKEIDNFSVIAGAGQLFLLYFKRFTHHSSSAW
jgi:hypothetical protein